jgi:hypothetical protein
MGAASIVFNFLTPCTVTKFDVTDESRNLQYPLCCASGE